VQFLGGEEDHIGYEEAAKVLKSLEDYAIDPLVNALHDANWRLRKRAAETLGEFGKSIPIEALAQILNDSVPAVRLAAIKALGRAGERTPIEPLIQLLADSNV